MAKRKRKAKKGSAEAPTSSCLLICDDVLLSIGRNKHILHGVIDRIDLPALPSSIGPFVAYVRFSNVYGAQEVVLRLCSAENDADVFAFKAKSPKQSDPLGTHTLILRIPEIQVQRAGKYFFQATHDGVQFAESMIEINSLTGDETP